MKFASWIRAALAATVVLAAGTVASAQEAFTVSPESGAVGQEITLTASEDGAFGPRRGRLVLNLSVAKRRRAPRAKVVSWSENEIVFTIHRAAAGFQDITVRPRGRRVTPLGVNGGLEVLPPQLTGRSADRFGKGDTISLFGNNFGTVRGRVKLVRQTGKKGRGRRPKILSWSNNTVEVRLPTRGPDGLFDIELSNFAGVAESMSPIELTPPLAPITGKNFVSGRGEGAFRADEDGRDDQISSELFGEAATISGTDTRGSSSRSEVHSVSFTFLTSNLVEVGRTYSGSEVSEMTYSITQSSRRGESTSTYALDRDGEVTITNASGGRIRGTYGGRLTRTSGDGRSSINLSGEFIVDVP